MRGQFARRNPVVLLLSIGSSAVWIVCVTTSAPTPPSTPGLIGVAVAGDAVGFWSSSVATVFALDFSRWRVESFLLHPFLHEHFVHLGVSLAALFSAGRLLEQRWGSLRFASFVALVTVMTALAGQLAAAIAAGFELQSLPFRVFGTSAISLACLVAVSDEDHELEVCRGVPFRYAIWALVLVGATGLALLDRPQPGAAFRTLHVSQGCGVLVGLLFVRLMPGYDAFRLRLGVTRRRHQERRVTEARERVEVLLEKISRDGIQSLSSSERRFLRQASKHY